MLVFLQQILKYSTKAKRIVCFVIMCLIFQNVKAQWGGYVQQIGTQITADTCIRNTGSFIIQPAPGSSWYSSITVQSATFPFQVYQPSNMNASLFENLPAGTYDIIPIPFDPNDLAYPTTVTIDAYSTISFTSNINQPTCTVNGLASINLLSGVAPITFLWSNNATTSSIVLPQGNYNSSVRIMGGDGCYIDEYFQIYAATTVALNPQVTQPTCSNAGNIVLNATGVAPFTYLWSNNATTPTLNPINGTYSLSVTVTGNDGCIKTETFSIQTNQNPKVYINSCDNYVHNGIIYTQSTILNENFSQGGCIENKQTHINIYPSNTGQLAASNLLFNCVDSALLTVSGNNENHIKSINWLRNGANLNTTQVNVLTTIAGGNGEGSAFNQFGRYSSNIAVDNLGNTYVSDPANYRVLMFPPNSNSATQGIVVAGGNGFGVALNQLPQPGGLFVKGNFLYVADVNTTYDRIMKFPINPYSPTGTGVIVAHKGVIGHQIFVSASDELYTSRSGANEVSKYPANSDEFTDGIVVAGSRVGLNNCSACFNPGSSSGSALNRLTAPQGIWVKSNGDLYIADGGNNRIVKWQAGATSGVIVAGGNGVGNTLTQIEVPRAIIFDALGDMYVLHGSSYPTSRVSYFQSNSNSNSNGNIFIDNISSISGLVFDNNGKLLIVNGLNFRVVRLDKQLTKKVYQTGTYSAEVVMDNGCTVTVGPVNITSNVAAATRDTFNEAGCESYSWNDIVYTSSTTVFDTIKYVGTNCDSIYRVVNITIHPKTYSTTNVQLCPNQFPYSWNGSSYTTIGTYNVTLPMANSNVCDSIATLNITAKNNCCTTTYSTTNESFCFTKNPFSWNGSNYYTSGTYTVKLVNANGCDSMATLNLVVGTPNYSTTTETACDSYTWNGYTYTTSGTYNFNTTNSNGCDSTATLFLTINASPVVNLTTANAPCDNPKTLVLNGLPVGASVQWFLNNQTFTSGSTNTSPFTIVAGGNGVGNSINQLNENVHICRDAAGNIYITDSENDRVLRVDAITNAITIAAGGNGRGNAANQLNRPVGVNIGTSGTNLIITDHYNHRVVRWTLGATSGVTIAGTGSSGSNANQLAFPINAIEDGKGNVYVVDRNNNRIQRFASGSTTAVTAAGGNGQGNALNQLSLPTDVDFDNNEEDLIIADRFNGRVMRWVIGATAGTVEASTGLSQPYAVFIVANGTKYITDVDKNNVTRWAANATTGSVVAGSNPTLNYPTGVTINNSGCLVISDFGHQRVITVCGNTNSTLSTTTAGTYTATITANGCTTTAGPLVITMPSVVENNITYDSCGSVTLNNITYTNSTVLNQTFKDVNGCDSVINITNINIKPIDDKIEIVNMDGCGSVTYSGTVYTSNTNFYDTISIDKEKCVRNINDVNITINPWTNNYDTVNIDSCGSVIHNGIIYTASVSKNDTTIADCVRYIHTLNITVTPWTIEEITTTYTGCGSVQVGDIIYTSDTTLYDTIVKPTGCVKNVYITIINVRAYQYNVTTTNLFGCGSVTHNGIVYTQSKVLSDTTDVSTDTICKKNVYTVNITVTPWTIIDTTIRLNGCGNVTYKDNVYTASTTLNSTSQNTTTCTKINTTVIITVTPWVVYNDTTRLNGCGSYELDGITYTSTTTLFSSNVREDSCIRRNRVTIITVNQVPNVSISNNSNPCSNPQTITLTGSSTAANITWIYNGTTLSTTTPTVTNTLVTVAGGNGSGNAANQLNTPLSAVTDAQGRIYVADYFNERIQRFPAGSTSLTNGVTIAGTGVAGFGATQFNRPSGVALGVNDTLYVADYNNTRIMRYNPNSVGGDNGTRIGTGFSRVNKLFLTPSFIYATESNVHSISRVARNAISTTARTTAAGQRGFSGIGNNSLNNPVSVFVDANENVYIADKLNHRIMRWDNGATTGVVVAGTGTAGSNANELNQPVDVTFDAQGRMYVADEQNHRIIRFAANSVGGDNGTVLVGNGTAGNTGTQLSSPEHVFFDAAGNLFIADAGNHRIVTLQRTIDSTIQVSNTGTYIAVATFPNGCTTRDTITVNMPPVVVRDTARYSGCGKVTNPNNNVEYTTSTILRDTSRTANGCDSLIKVTIIIVTPWNIINDTIRVTGCSSVLYNDIIYTHSDTLRTSIVKEDSCIRRDTTIIITVNQPPIIEIVNTSNVCDSVQTLNINNVPQGASVQFYRNNVSISNLQKGWTGIGKTVAGITNNWGNFLSQLNRPHNVFVKNDTMYIADWGNHRVLRWKIGATQGTLVAGTGIAGLGLNELYRPNDVIVDEFNNLYINEYFGNRVVKWLNGATSGSIIGGTGSHNNIDELNYPRGMDRDQNGDIYVTDAGHSRVVIYNGNPLVPNVVAYSTNYIGSNYNYFYNPAQVKLAGNGDVYIADQGMGRILKFPKGIPSTPPHAVSLVADGLYQPWGLFIDKHQNIYVAETGIERIVRFPAGSNGLQPPTVVAGSIAAGSRNFELRSPAGIFVDDAGRLFVADDANHRIQMFDSSYIFKATKSGTYTVVVTDANGCTSTQTIVVNIPPVVLKDTNNVVTGCGSVTRNGINYIANTVIATDTIRTIVNHCDSVIHYTRIIINQLPVVSLQNISSKPCSNPQKIKLLSSASPVTVVWQMGGSTVASGLNVTELTVTQSGTYTAIVTDANGCTSTTSSINVYVIYPTARAASITACNSYIRNGIVYTKDVKLKDTLRSVNGCDSVLIETTVTISKNLTPSLSILVRGSDINCKGSNLSIKAFPVNGGINPQYQWTVNGVPVAGANDVYFISNNLNNGDTIRCILTSNYPCLATNNVVSSYIIARVIAPTFKQVNISGCNSATVNNITYQNTAVVLDTVRNNIGCDSIITTTNITINKINAETTTSNIVGCNSVVYNGVTYVNSITLKDTLRSSKGCDSLYRINNIIVTKVVAVTNVANLSGCGSVTTSSNKKYTTSVVLNDTVKSVLGCDSVYNITNIVVTALATPTITISATQTAVCLYIPVLLTASVTNGGLNPQYQWYKNGVLIPNATAATLSQTYIGIVNQTFVYSCVLTSNATCTSPLIATSNNLSITVATNSNATASINITANQTTICSTATVIFTATATNGGTNPQYQWKKNGVNITGANAATYSTATIINNDVFTCQLTSNSPCVSTTNVISNGIAITVNASSFTFVINDGSIIVPASVQLNIPTPISTTNPAGGIWSAEYGTIANGNITFSQNLSGENRVFYQLSNQISKCTTNYRYGVYVFRLPTPLTGNTTLCTLGSTTTISTTSMNTGVWTSSNPSVASVTYTQSISNRSATITALSAGTTTISYTMYVPGGFAPSVSTTITVAPVTVAPIIGNTSICVGSTTQLTNATPNGVWSSIFGRASVNANGLITGVSAGVAEIRYTVNNAATGCSAYAVKSITVNAIPLVPTITYAPTTSNPQLGAGTGQFCLNRTFDVVGSPLGGTWTSSNTNIMTVTSLGTINTVGLGSGTLNYRITTNGCSNSRTMSGTIVGCAVKGVSINNEQLVMSNDFTMYPNPAKSAVNINVETLAGKGSIVVTDLYGKVVKTQKLSMGTNILNIANLATGMYFVSMITTEGKETKKLIVE